MENLELASLTLAIALVLGIIVQSIAKHINIPGIILALLTGVAIGPDGLSLIDPQNLGEFLNFIIGIAVAIILFEGGMLMNLKRIKKEAVVLRRMITYGALVTAVGAGALTYFILDWTWQISLLFGSLVIVTGPTVITPLLRKIRINSKLQTILEGEGVLIDPIGAIIAIVALDFVLTASTESFFHGLLSFHLKLGIGFLVGAAGGFLLAFLLRFDFIIPDEFETTLTVTFVLFIFEISNYLSHESGIMAVVIAGMVVGNAKIPQHRQLLHTKEQISTMLVGMLFILLSADVRLSSIQELGVPGLIVVLLLMAFVRPINIFLCTLNTDTTSKEKFFISWLGPRGIIAAAVASLFVFDLNKAGMEGGQELRALVFMVIFVTVVIQGLTADPIAALLNLKRKFNTGYVIAGANPLARILALILTPKNEDIVLIDRNATDAQLAEEQGLKVIWGNVLSESTLLRAEVDAKKAAIGLTSNYAVNAMFLNKVNELAKETTLLGAVTDATQVSRKSVRDSGAKAAFATDIDFDLWNHMIKGNKASLESYVFVEGKDFLVKKDDCLLAEIPGALPLALETKDKIDPVYPGLEVKKDTTLHVLVDNRRQKEIIDWMETHGFKKGSNEINIRQKSYHPE